MSNEIVLIITMLVTFSALLVCFRFLGKQGLYMWMATATVLANVEVLMLVHAFGIDMTLGNILFASTFLATDILSEMYGEKTARKGALAGVYSLLIFCAVAFSWRFYTPHPQSAVVLNEVFAQETRVIIASFVVFAFAQLSDVWLYGRIWDITTSRCGDRQKFLWLRNNAATIIAQFLNALLFNFCAFWGTYSIGTLLEITFSTFVIYIATSLVDTPFLYAARKIAKNHEELLG